MRIRMQNLLLILAVASPTAVSACHVTYRPVNLNTLEARDLWDGNYRGGRTAEPAGR